MRAMPSAGAENAEKMKENQGMLRMPRMLIILLLRDVPSAGASCDCQKLGTPRPKTQRKQLENR